MQPLNARNSKPNPEFTLFDVGTETTAAYDKYGRFENAGTASYRYVITNKSSLSKAVGEGIFPNTIGVLKDPNYQKLRYAGKLEGMHWDFVNIDDNQLSFFKWATATEEPGVRQFYTSLALERAGLIEHAIKSYYACVVHFPKSHSKTYWNTPWYIGPVAIDRIHFILNNNPQLGLKLVDAKIEIKNRYDDDIKNDVISANPGKFVKVSPREVRDKRTKVNGLQVSKEIGSDHVKLIKYTNGHWQLKVDGEPFIIQGVGYSPNKVGLSPDNGTLVPHEDWMKADYNSNGKIDGPYDAWVDTNRNNKQDRNEPVVGDFALLKDMGANTIRIYHHTPNEPLIADLYKTYGIMALMGDLLGAYTVGSGADWYTGTDYTDKQQQANMIASAMQMVEKYKDKPYVLMWVLGNENNYGVATNAKENPVAFYKFANEVAKMIKEKDPAHPVAISNGDILYLDIAAKHAPDIDVFGCNVYRGEAGFEKSVWADIKEVYGKPAFITETGCPAYAKGKTLEEAEKLQADYLRHSWIGIGSNSAGYGEGNALGGVIFEWIDEWWKAGTPPQYDPAKHDTVGQWMGPFPDGWMYEEWLGIAGQGDGNSSPFLRELRQAYFTLKELWTKNNNWTKIR